MKKTKAMLEADNEQLRKELAAMTTERDSIQEKKEEDVRYFTKKIEQQQKDHQNTLNKIGFMLRGPVYQEVNIVSGFNTMKERNTMLSEIAFNIGELKVMQQEYFDLKDRCLPVSKMKLMQEEFNRKGQ